MNFKAGQYVKCIIPWTHIDNPHSNAILSKYKIYKIKNIDLEKAPIIKIYLENETGYWWPIRFTRDLECVCREILEKQELRKRRKNEICKKD